ncbi:MAG: hypothetical protein OXH09_18135 [Gammaproteobacteria bacterium]|nr:hypothetical protein [Gammaproteobacteria bacterium]
MSTLRATKDVFERLRADGSPLLRALVDMRTTGAIPRPRFTARMIAWKYRPSGEVSIVGGAPVSGLLSERDDATGMPLVATRHILEGKLVGRVCGHGKLLARDGYDLACAYKYDPEALAWAMSRVGESERMGLVPKMESVLASHKRIILGRHLQRCAHPRIARDPWRAFAFRGDSWIQKPEGRWPAPRWFPVRRLRRPGMAALCGRRGSTTGCPRRCRSTRSSEYTSLS